MDATPRAALHPAARRPITLWVDHHRASGLKEGGVVHLDVGGERPVLRATVLAFLGPHTVVKFGGDFPRHRLDPGATGYLMVDSGGRLRALAATVATVIGRCALLRITDGFRLGQRRGWTRVPARIDATLVQAASDAPPLRCETLDLSPVGVRLLRPPGTPVWARYDLTLESEELGAPLTVEAVPARAGQTFLALRFTTIAQADARRLEAFVVKHCTDVAAADPAEPVAAVAA